MNLNRLYEILSETTTQLRKGDAVHGDKHLVEAIADGRDLDKEPGGIWNVITPATMGFTGAEARQMAGGGFVMMTGFNAPNA